MNTTTPKLHRAAKIISVVGHPFVLLPVTVFLVSARNSSLERAATIGGVTVLATVVPLLLVIRRKVVGGNWSDHDISERAERRAFYPVAITVVAIAGLVFWLLDFPRPLVIGTAVGLLLLLAAAFINRWSKISLHLMFVAYCAASLTALSCWAAAIMFFLAVLVGWSRVALDRHSLGQVLGGAALGAAGGIFLVAVISLL